jgi:hypothetical protein
MKKKKKLPLPPEAQNKRDLKYFLYEHSVQCPEWHVKHFPRYYLWLTGRKAKTLREDFCGTSRISMEWVRSAKDRTATGIDLDPEPISYFKRFHLPKLTPDEASRIHHEKRNVLQPTKEKYDLIAACNFSFFIFKERETLIEYFRAARESLVKKGALFLEMAGGEGMQEWLQEERKVSIPGYGKILYVWDQMEFDAISGVNDYHIHFQLPNRRWMKNAFEYHWRLYGIREIREALMEAGFSKTQVFWETADRSGKGTGEYAPTEKGDPAHAWIAYVAAIR